MSMQQYLGLALQASIMLTVLGLGLTASWQEATYLLRKPAMLLRSVLAMSVLLPIVAVVIVRTFAFPLEIEAALVALAISPVPPLLHMKQLKSGGRREFVVGLLAGMGLLAIVLVPVSVAILNAVFSTSLLVPPQTVAAVVLKTILVPLALGLLIHRWVPAVGKAARPVIALAFVLLLVATVLLLYGMWPVTRTLLGNGVGLMLAVVAAIGLLVGHLLGGPRAEDRTTLAMATAARHPAVALTIASATQASKPSLLAVILLYVVIATIITIPYQKWRQRGAQSESPGA
ncbi:MAG TPA: hypothetical protein VGI91_12250 [Steroidobacteraceae bacterium]|jgi:BASS family bile acid:Na+ symporter